MSSHRMNEVTPAPQPGPVNRSSQAWTLIELARTVIRRRRLLTVVSAVAMAIIAVVMIFSPNWYVSTASLLPSGKTDQMSALKEAVGIANPGAVDENSSVLFPIVLRSRTIADGVLQRTYTIEHEGRTLTIKPTEYFETSDPDELRQALADVTAVTIEKKTGDIHLEVESKYPRFSQVLAQAYLEELEDFNLNRRRSMAKENVRYLEGQILRTRDSLRTAEEALAEFRRRNADWAGNSNYEILSELTKLQRETEIKTAAYVYLQQQLEMARLDVQRDVPVTRVLDAPSLPTLKSRPRRTLSVLVAGFAAFMVTLCIILFQEYVKREQNGLASAAYHDLRHDLQQSMPRATRAIRFISRRKTPETVSAE